MSSPRTLFENAVGGALAALTDDYLFAELRQSFLRIHVEYAVCPSRLHMLFCAYFLLH